jgi:hypothetical protein
MTDSADEENFMSGDEENFMSGDDSVESFSDLGIKPNDDCDSVSNDDGDSVSNDDGDSVSDDDLGTRAWEVHGSDFVLVTQDHGGNDGLSPNSGTHERNALETNSGNTDISITVSHWTTPVSETQNILEWRQYIEYCMCMRNNRI